MMRTPYPLWSVYAARLLWQGCFVLLLHGTLRAQYLRFRTVSPVEAMQIMGEKWRPDTVRPTNVQKKPIRKFWGNCAPFSPEEAESMPIWMHEYTFTLADGKPRRIVESQTVEGGHDFVSNVVQSIKVYQTKTGYIYSFRVVNGWCRSEAHINTILHYAGAPMEGITLSERPIISPEGRILDAGNREKLVLIHIGRAQHMSATQEWQRFADREKLHIYYAPGGFYIPREYEAYAVRNNPNACLLWFPRAEGMDYLMNPIPLEEVFVLVEW